MTEYERVREEAASLIEKHVKSMRANLKLPDYQGKIAVAEQLLSLDGIEIRADDQSLPIATLPRGYELTNPILRRVIQEDMLKPDKEGKHWVRVIPKGR